MAATPSFHREIEPLSWQQEQRWQPDIHMRDIHVQSLRYNFTPHNIHYIYTYMRMHLSRSSLTVGLLLNFLSSWSLRSSNSLFLLRAELGIMFLCSSSILVGRWLNLRFRADWTFARWSGAWANMKNKAHYKYIIHSSCMYTHSTKECRSRPCWTGRDVVVYTIMWQNMRKGTKSAGKRFCNSRNTPSTRDLVSQKKKEKRKKKVIFPVQCVKLCLSHPLLHIRVQPLKNAKLLAYNQHLAIASGYSYLGLEWICSILQINPDHICPRIFFF